MKTIKLLLSNSAENEITEARFEDDEYQLLLDYFEEIKRIKRNSSFTTNFHVSMHMNAAIGKPVEYNFSLPDEDKFLLALHLVRPFMLNTEQLYFYKVVNILHQRIDNNKVSNLIDYNKKMFSGKKSQEIIIVQTDEMIINSENFLMKFLNAFEYHRDKKKQAFFAKLFEVFPENLARYFVISLIIDRIKAIYNIGIIIGVIIGEVKDVDFLQ